jgi:ArsR family transcriptional regulator, arsenate/arsenite/antimonite-responsive transcriptional repressor / arsenate reductase (thioredoxin)
MNAEVNLRERAGLHAALGDPARLAIVDALALNDASPGELARRFDLPSNLLAHHLRVLESAGVVTRTRSEADGRRTYVHLTAVAFPLVVPQLATAVHRVVFVCTHNSARSQLAAALWAARSAAPVACAGTHPAARVHPGAEAVARRRGVPLRSARTAHVRDVLGRDDLLVAVCDRAYEELGVTQPAELHWSVPDPARVEDPAAFDDAFSVLDEWVGRLAGVVSRDRGGET